MGVWNGSSSRTWSLARHASKFRLTVSILARIESCDTSQPRQAHKYNIKNINNELYLAFRPVRIMPALVLVCNWKNLICVKPAIDPIRRHVRCAVRAFLPDDAIILFLHNSDNLIFPKNKGNAKPESQIN